VRTLLALAATLVVLALGASLTHLAGGGAFSLALALPVVVWLGLGAGLVEGAVAAALVGVLLDAAAGGPAGLQVFLSVMLFLSSRAAAGAFDGRSTLGFALLSAVGTLCYGLGAILLTRYVSTAEVAPRWALGWRVLVEATLTGAAAVAIRPLLDRFVAPLKREDPGLLR